MKKKVGCLILPKKHTREVLLKAPFFPLVSSAQTGSQNVVLPKLGSETSDYPRVRQCSSSGGPQRSLMRVSVHPVRTMWQEGKPGIYLWQESLQRGDLFSGQFGVGSQASELPLREQGASPLPRAQETRVTRSFFEKEDS
jgi:hypothetical protein